MSPTAGTVAHRAIVLQHKTQQPVQFELTDQTRESVAAWIAHAKLRSEGFLFPSRVRQSPHLTTRQYARLVNRWVAMVGLDPADYGTHSLRRTKATLIYRRTKNLRAVQLLLGHRKLELAAMGVKAMVVSLQVAAGVRGPVHGVAGTSRHRAG